MNQFAFFYPAKIIFAEHNIELTPVEREGFTFYLGPIGRKYFFNSDKKKIVFEHIENDKRQLFAKVGEHICPFHVTFIDNIDAFIDSALATVKQKYNLWDSQIKNPELYEAEATATREKIRAERAERDREEEERKAARAKAAEEAYQKSLALFIEGTRIAWADFERACKENNIKMPIKTIGYGRKNIHEVGTKGWTTYGSRHNSPIVWEAVENLQKKLVGEK